MSGFGDVILSEGHTRMLAAAVRQERLEEQERADRVEGAAWQRMMTAPAIQAMNRSMQDQAEVVARRQELQEAKARERRVAAAEDHRAALLMGGHRPRSLSEILAAAAGVV